MKIKVSGKKLYPSNSAEYLGERIDRFLPWHNQVNNIAIKLNRAKSEIMKKNLKKIMKNKKKLRNIYFAIFDSHLSRLCIFWAQNINTVNRLITLQKKVLRITNFKDQ